MPQTRLALILISLVTLTFLIYAASLTNSFVWDDYLVIVNNNFVKSWSNFPSIFTESYLTSFADIDNVAPSDMGSGETTYRPVVTLSYFFDYWLWKLNPVGYHFSNILFHIINVLLIFKLIELMLNNRRLATVTAFLFALHPVNAEAVNVISFREDLLTFLFYVSSFILYIKLDRERTKKRIFFYVGSLVCFLFALFSKEMALTFPIALVLYDYLFRNVKFRLAYIGYLTIFLFYIVVRFFVMTNPASLPVEYAGGSFYTNFLTMAKVIGSYAGWLFFPVNVHPTLPDDPDIISYSLLTPMVIFSLTLIMSSIYIAIKFRKIDWRISFSILWFFITLLPVVNIVPITNYMASRYLYLPSVGFCFFIALLITRLEMLRVQYVRPVFLKYFARDTIILLLIFYSFFTILDSITYRNNTILWREMTDRYPRNALAHSNLASHYMHNKFLCKAIQEYKTAISLDPYYAKDHNSLGTCYYKKGMLDEAIREFHKAIELDPYFMQARVNFCSVLGEKGQYDEAIDCFKRVIERDPRYVEAYNNLGITYARMKRWKEAREVWEIALSIDPLNKKAQKSLERLRLMGY